MVTYWPYGTTLSPDDPDAAPGEAAKDLLLRPRRAPVTEPAPDAPPAVPAGPAPVVPDVRLVTYWPYGAPVNPDDPDAAPWEAAGELLARLHRIPVAGVARGPVAATLLDMGPGNPGALPAPAGQEAAVLPAMRGPAKAARAITRLRAALAAASAPHPAAAPVLRAWAALPPWARAEAPMPVPGSTLCHGDLHLGQLVRHPPPDGPWRLIDVDDLGVGVPAWDLARPAAWFACGLLPPDEWTRFLTAYRTAGGPAVPAEGDPWAALDVPARALTVQTAALFLAKALAAVRELDEVEQCLVDACDRMGSAPPELPAAFPK
ncbi:phosphotransferase family protein [Streptomyces sp. NPDC086787]|uniref:phosphotransferase family protein n=1 Tax=Streptomyces sp. NPDC086787 TaxID=3365759 RepID=UPI00380DB00E